MRETIELMRQVRAARARLPDWGLLLAGLALGLALLGLWWQSRRRPPATN